MKADTVDLANVFGKPVRYLVPLFQRPYVWTQDKQWEPLWADIQAVAERQLDDTAANDAIPHFMGAVVLDQVLMPTGMIEARYVVDGQQRLTTLQLFVAAVRSIAGELGQTKAAQMLEKLLYNDEFLVKQPGDRLKMQPTVFDRQAFADVLEDGKPPAGSHLMLEAYRYFRASVWEWAVEGQSESETAARLDALSTVVWKLLVVVSIDLAPGDNAQVIFETLNARGTPLLAADLIKNHLFQVAASQGADIDDLYEKYWMPLDRDWWRAEISQGRLKRPRLDIYANHWLAMRLGREVVSHLLFPDFKRYLAGSLLSAEAVLADFARYAAVYQGFEEEPRTTDRGRFLDRLGVMEVTTAYPAMLWILGPEGLEEADARRATQAIESYLVRRMLVRATTKRYNVTFLGMLRNLMTLAEARSPSADDVIAFLSGLKGDSQFWPTDEQVLASVRTMPAYASLTRSRLRMVLEALETHLHTPLTEGFTIDSGLTIEHVLPQDWRTNWPLPIDTDPMEATAEREAAKHLLGNLTLVTGSLNPTLSNGPWPTKRAYLREHSILRLSADIRDAEAWDEPAIHARSERLGQLCLETWIGPDGAAAADEQGASSAEEPSSGPDTDALAEVLALADTAQVGRELRSAISKALSCGIFVKPFPYGVLFSPPSDHRVMIFTVWPQPDAPGTFAIWRSPKALAAKNR